MISDCKRGRLILVGGSIVGYKQTINEHLQLNDSKLTWRFLEKETKYLPGPCCRCCSLTHFVLRAPWSGLSIKFNFPVGTDEESSFSWCRLYMLHVSCSVEQELPLLLSHHLYISRSESHSEIVCGSERIIGDGAHCIPTFG